MTSNVIIAGAGVGGAAAALLLARDGHRVTVLERSTRGAALGAGLLLQPNGLRALDELGLLPAVERAGHRMRSVRILGPTGRPLVDAPVPDDGHLLVVRRSHLATVLAEALDHEPGVTVLYGATVDAADRRGSIAYRHAGVAVAHRADLVVGADGVGSKVRCCGRFGAESGERGSTYLRFLVDAPAPGLDGEAWTPLGIFGGASLGDGTTYVYADATAAPVQAALQAGDVDRLRDLWAEAFPAAGPAFACLRSVDELLVNEVRTVRCRTYVDGRLVLLGDAAHAMEPTLGQGANSALVDAVVLARALREGDDASAALATYDAIRRPAVAKVQKEAERVARLARLRSPVARRLRDVALRAASSRPAAAERRFRRLQQAA